MWVDCGKRHLLEKAGIQFLNPAQVMTFHQSCLLKKYANEFIGIQETSYLLNEMNDRYSELTKEVQRILPVQKTAEIFQRLVEEQISIRNLRMVLEALVDWGQKEKDTVLLTEYIRSALKRQISYQHSGGNVLSAYLLDPDLEETIRGAIRQTSSGSYLALDPQTSQTFLNNLKAEVKEINTHGPRSVLLISMDIRRYIRKMIELDLYNLPVLSYQELTREIIVQPLAKISL